MKTAASAGPGLIKSAVLSWLGFRWTDVEQWRAFYGRESNTGEVVSVDKALRTVAYPCVRLISQRIGTLPFNLYRRVREDRELVRNHPLAPLLHIKPNAKMTAPVFWEAVVASILLQRGAFLERQTNSAGVVSSIGFLHPCRISLDKNKNQYRFSETDGTIRFIPADRVVHIPAYTTDGENGISVIEYGLQAFGLALAAEKAAAKTFKNGLLPTTVFKFPKVLNKIQRDDARTTIETLSGATNAGKPIIVEAGMEVDTIGINPRDAQLLESRQLSAEEICSLFGVPPTMIGRGDKASSWASSAEQLNLWFLNYTLMPWMKRIEAAVTCGFLTPVEQIDLFAEFNFEGMLRGDSSARREFYASALQNGWMNRNQVARIENRPTFEGGDIYTVQSNLIPIDRLGTDTTQNIRSALAAWLKEEKPDAA